VTKLYLFICANYTRGLSPKNAPIITFFFSNRTRSAIFQMPSLILGKTHQKMVGLYFFAFFCFVARQKKATLVPGAWPKSKPRGGGSVVSKAALFVG
jgi:hypothetical protein